MISSLQLYDFKNFDSAELRLGPFTVIVGTNASGKSNIRDAFRLIHGIGRGYAFAEAIEGKYGTGGQVEWEAVRGAPLALAKFGNETFGLNISVTLADRNVSYFVVIGGQIFGGSGFRVWSEELREGDKVICARSDDGFEMKLADSIRGLEKYFRLDQSLLTQLHEVHPNTGTGAYTGPMIDAFASMRFLDLVPDRMRRPSFPSQTVLGDGGENLPTILKRLCDDVSTKEILAQWIRELTPMDVRGFEFPVDPNGRVHLILKEGGERRVPAQSASDGTLRILAILATLLGPNPASLYFFEEIDNGIHPSRLNLLIDLIEKQTAKGEIQVVATTHSPQLLSMVSDSTFQNTSVVCRLEHSEDAIIRPVADLPNATELRKSQGLGRLLAGGWIETAVAFTEGIKNDGKDPV